MIYLPFQDTTISASRSLAQIVDMLVDIGFSEVAQFTINGVKSVKAAHNGAVFEFVANIDGGRLVLTKANNESIYFADYVVEKIEAGKITAGQLTKPLLIEGKVEK
jgi:uncharacterized protein YkvS